MFGLLGWRAFNEYVYHLILREQERITQKDRIESLLLEGLESGEAVEATDAWWEEKRSQLVKRFQPSDT